MPLPVGQQRHVRLKQVAFIDIHGSARAHDLVDPRLERRRHAEVVERRADQQHVRGNQLIHQLVALDQCVVHP